MNMIMMFPLLLILATSAVMAQEPVVNVEWDPVADSRVGLYVIGIGSEPGRYDDFVKTSETQAGIPDLGLDTYYIAARACKADESLCSDWSNEISHVNPIGTPGNLRKAAQNLESSLGNMTNAVAQVVEEVNKLEWAAFKP